MLMHMKVCHQDVTLPMADNQKFTVRTQIYPSQHLYSFELQKGAGYLLLQFKETKLNQSGSWDGITHPFTC